MGQDTIWFMVLRLDPGNSTQADAVQQPRPQDISVTTQESYMPEKHEPSLRSDGVDI